MGYVPIPDDELLELKRDYEEKEKINVRYGDIVLVQNGPYRKLWGIVLRIDGNHYEVGFNFCEGPLVVNLKPENIKVMSTVEDYRDLLASYMRYLKTPNRSQQKVLGSFFCYPYFSCGQHFAYRTGELEPNKNVSSGYYDITLGEYTTGGVNLMNWQEGADKLWNQYYTFLGPINTIISGVETAEGEDERLRDYVKGEALVWRVYSYFKLLQYYSPYRTGEEYGIPVFLKPYEDPGNAMPERKTQTEVYQQIFSDCEEVFELLQRTPSTHWNCAYQTNFMHSMLAHIYWYKAMSVVAEETDWANALEHAEQALTGRTFVRDSATYALMFDATSAINASPSSDLYDLFKEDDVRKLTYFRKKVDETIIYDKYNISANTDISVIVGARSGGGIIMFFRAAEMQLIKAEALYRLGREGEAKEALDFFKQGRYLDVANSYTESDLLNEILKERKLEFYHEQDMWWIDMKRLGTRMERVLNGTLYVLEPDDWRYCFPIPQSEMEVNKNMVQNPGWDEVNF